MTKQILLGSMQTIDTDVQTVQTGQIVVYEGPGATRIRYAVYDITHDKWGYAYHLVSLEDFRTLQSDYIRPMSEKFDKSIYYDDAKPEYLTPEQVAQLKAKADERRAAEAKARAEEREERNRIEAVGADKLRKVVPPEAKAVIIAHLHENDSDPYTDYRGCHTVRTVILGFSTHTRDIFSEMRKAAAHFRETAHLSEPNPEYEHREKYSMGHGYYLGLSYYSGWIVEKEPFNGIEGLIRNFAYTAGCEGGLQLKASRTTDGMTETGTAPVEGVKVEIVNYSEKAIAVFGDTKPIKEVLSGLHGLFRPYLSRNGVKTAGWIFSRKQKQKIRETLAPYLAE